MLFRKIKSHKLRLKRDELSVLCGYTLSLRLKKKYLHLGNFLNVEMNWILLIIAGLFEVGFAFCLGKAKESAGLTATYWYVGFIVSLAISMLLLIKVTKELPIGTAYAVWTGVGAAGTALVGIIVFKEPADFWRIFFIMTLIASIIGLKFVTH